MSLHEYTNESTNPNMAEVIEEKSYNDMIVIAMAIKEYSNRVYIACIV